MSRNYTGAITATVQLFPGVAPLSSVLIVLEPRYNIRVSPARTIPAGSLAPVSFAVLGGDTASPPSNLSYTVSSLDPRFDGIFIAPLAVTVAELDTTPPGPAVIAWPVADGFTNADALNVTLDFGKALSSLQSAAFSSSPVDASRVEDLRFLDQAKGLVGLQLRLGQDGSYSLDIASGAVRDFPGNPSARAQFTFVRDSQAPPPAVITGPASYNLADPHNVTLHIAFKFPLSRACCHALKHHLCDAPLPPSSPPRLPPPSAARLGDLLDQEPGSSRLVSRHHQCPHRQPRGRHAGCDPAYPCAGG